MQISSSKYNFIVPHQSNLINSKRLHMFSSMESVIKDHKSEPACQLDTREAKI